MQLKQTKSTKVVERQTSIAICYRDLDSTMEVKPSVKEKSEVVTDVQMENLEAKYSITTDLLTSTLLTLLRDNDNSENPWDDAYWIKQVLKALGNCFSLVYCQ